MHAIVWKIVLTYQVVDVAMILTTSLLLSYVSFVYEIHKLLRNREEVQRLLYRTKAQGRAFVHVSSSSLRENMHVK